MVGKDSPEAGRLLSRLGIVSSQEEGDYETAQAAFAQAITIAHQTGDEALEMSTLAYAAQVDYFRLNLAEALDKSRRALELGKRARGDRALVIANGYLANASILQGSL